jgi:hypothetical protein
MTEEKSMTENKKADPAPAHTPYTPTTIKKDSTPEKEYEFKDDAATTPVSGDVEVEARKDREPTDEELERARTTGIALELPPGAFRVSGDK